MLLYRIVQTFLNRLIRYHLMVNITANDLKAKGVSALEAALQKDGEAVTTVRGQRKYAVLNFDTYNKLCECELDIALREARSDIAKGNYSAECVEGHMKRVLA